MSANKYYVVWKGHAPGVYDSWEEAELQVSGYPDAEFRAFKTQEQAVHAFREGFDKQGLINEVNREMKRLSDEGTAITCRPWNVDSIAVDAACSGNPGPMEYRGVYLRTGEQLFKVGPMADGTNNIGEFLAIVHALALQERQGTRLTIYSDSLLAQQWVSKGYCATKVKQTPRNAPIFDLIRRAEAWLRHHPVAVPICKWDTKAWGEIPADFGRK